MTFSMAFELIEARTIRESRIEASFFRHRNTGAQVLSLCADDENKVFGITFRTPPRDSTGIAHILEHSVLCGSRKYPVKEPFVELLKGSLHTFLNAFTYPDRTCYPVASQNLQDFYNLIDVYLDAVFYPRITPEVLQQEGWHFEMEDSNGPLTFKGVVYNEMKGAYSSPDNRLMECSLQSLFPDNAYALDSGGDPKEIPNLTFEQFQAFHRTYYHPSNARVFFYGDDDPDRRLILLDEWFREFKPLEVDSAVKRQSRLGLHRRFVKPFMVGQDEDQARRGMVTLNWLLTETIDVSMNFALQILQYILLGMPGSPLRKALIDSGLGEDLAGEGLSSELRQIYFSIGLKGVREENLDRVEPLVLETLEELVRSGIHPHTVEAALNTLEFGLRENNTGHFPRGLSLMLRALATWTYDGDPLALVAFEEPFASLKKEIEESPGYFEALIRDQFLSNPHRTTVILQPDPDLEGQERAAERERLDNAFSRMSPEEVLHVQEQARFLKELQERPDPPEALAAIPHLQKEDLDKLNKPIPLEIQHQEGIPVLLHDLITNGIVYLDLGLDLRPLAAADLPYIPLLGRALVEMGTEKEDFVTFTRRISRKTGGIVSHCFTSDVQDAKETAARMFIRGKAVLDRTGDLVDLLRDMLFHVKLDNRVRFQQMVLEEKAGLEQGLIPAGHHMVGLRLRSHFSEAHWADEQMGGISYLFFLRDLAQRVERDWEQVLADLVRIRDELIQKAGLLVNVTADDRARGVLEPHLQGLLRDLPDKGPKPEQAWMGNTHAKPEGMILPAQVHYVGKGANLYDLGYAFHGSALVITRYLRNSYLWDRIRVQGGAYGAFCTLDRLSGVLTLLSYRDPNLLKTIEVFDEAGEFLRKAPLSDQELTKAIIGAIGAMDAHLLPDAKGFTSMVRHLTRTTEEDRQLVRDQVLGTTLDHFRAMARFLDEVKAHGLVKVLGPNRSMEEIQRERPNWMETISIL